MTPNEAVNLAVKNHEFRTFRLTTVSLPGGPTTALIGVCWCEAETAPYWFVGNAQIAEKAARDAHGRHQARLALMRSFGQWDT